MSSLRVVYVLFWLFLLHFNTAFSGPMEVPGRYQKGNSIEQNDWRHVLSSIESRLKSLDFLYTSQLTPTLEARLEHFQNRISGMELKLLRVETLLTSKLDRMSDNISSRHFRDDMVQTDMFRKIETVYDGITHRLAYMDRKSENGFLKMQEKSEALSKKLEIMNNALADKYDSIESQLSDLVDGMEDISTSIHNSGIKTTKPTEKQVNHTQQRQSEMQDNISKNNFPQDFINEVKLMYGNSTENLKLLKEELNDFTHSNSTEKSFNSFSDYLGRMLNDYASKVSDLGAQVTKSDYKIASHLSTIEKVVNSSRIEIQNSLRALMVQVGKLSPKSNIQYEVLDQKLLSDVAQKLDSNFEKVISTQNTFLESCHRLQMDESQLEGQISDILNKLIDNFEGTTREHHHVLRKIEGLLVKHDIHSKKELHQANANIMTLYEQSKKESKEIKENYKQTADNIEALFALIQNILGNGSGVIKRDISKEKEVIEYIQSLERALNFTKHQQMKMFDSYKATIETLLTISQTKQEDEKSIIISIKNSTETMSLFLKQFENLSKRLNETLTRDILNTVGKTYELVKKNNENLSRISDPSFHKDIDNNNKSIEVTTTQEMINNDTINAKTSNNDKDIDSLIREIFFTNGTELKTSRTTQDPCLDVDIDVRFNIGENSNNERSDIKCPNANALTFSQEDSEKDTTDCLEIPIDLRFDQDQTGKIGKKMCNKKIQEKKSSNNFEEQHINIITERITTER